MMDNPEKQGTRQTKLQSNKTCNTKTMRNTEHTKQPAVNLGPHLIVSRFWFLQGAHQASGGESRSSPNCKPFLVPTRNTPSYRW
jgi:hypothetical protein